MYESPIKIIEEIANQIKMEMEGNILKAVRRVAIDFDGEELLKALQYDSDQYKRGYEDGKRDTVVHGHVCTTIDRWSTMHQKCSECGEELEWNAYPNFCPNCGCRMDGGDNERC